MSGAPGSPSWPVTLLVATAVLLTAGVIVVTLIPLVRCKGWAIRNVYEEQVWRSLRYDFNAHSGITEDPKVSATPPPEKFCDDCRPAGKMTLLRSWLGRARSQ